MTTITSIPLWRYLAGEDIFHLEAKRKNDFPRYLSVDFK